MAKKIKTEEKETVVYSRHELPSEAEIPEAIHASLKVVEGRDAGKEFPLARVKTVVGRGNDADLQIDDDRMSRLHAKIMYRRHQFRVSDLKSANGTFLNGSEVKEYALRNQDKLLMGDTMFQFFIEVE